MVTSWLQQPEVSHPQTVESRGKSCTAIPEGPSFVFFHWRRKSAYLPQASSVAALVSPDFWVHPRIDHWKTGSVNLSCSFLRRREPPTFPPKPRDHQPLPNQIISAWKRGCQALGQATTTSTVPTAELFRRASERRSGLQKLHERGGACARPLRCGVWEEQGGETSFGRPSPPLNTQLQGGPRKVAEALLPSRPPKPFWATVCGTQTRSPAARD